MLLVSVCLSVSLFPSWSAQLVALVANDDVVVVVLVGVLRVCRTKHLLSSFRSFVRSSSTAAVCVCGSRSLAAHVRWHCHRLTGCLAGSTDARSRDRELSSAPTAAAHQRTCQSCAPVFTLRLASEQTALCVLFVGLLSHCLPVWQSCASPASKQANTRTDWRQRLRKVRSLSVLPLTCYL